jgi:hypothetical protein
MRTSHLSRLLVLMLATTALEEAEAQQQRKDVNYDESKVGAYTLPDPLKLANGQPVTTAEQWQKQRRPELLELFRANVYGRSPARVPETRFEVTKTDPKALGGLATRKEITVYFTGKSDGPQMSLLLYVPNGATKPVPAFLGPNFTGNHTVNADPGITITKAWMRSDKATPDKHTADESTRGTAASRWEVEKVLARGFATATFYYGEVEPDYAEGWKTGLRAALSPQGANTVWAEDAWGAIGAWGYALSRALDYLETDKDIDAKHVALHGHSRLGKTALRAGASDERFAIVISNDSGEGGAALTRRNIGETTAIITKAFPHWFCPRYATYANAADKLPIDQHELIALMAPRPVYIASASEDLWADPKGEFLSGKHAEPVYRLFGEKGLGVDEQPPADHPVGDFIGYHLRTGKHDITSYDWEQYMNFADRHFGRKAAR